MSLIFDPETVVITGAIRPRIGLQRRGIQIPMRVNRRGGTLTVTGDDNDIKIISTALSDNNNSHAFQQDPGLGADFIFGMNDEVVRGVIIQRLRDVFTLFELQNRYRLQEDSPIWSKTDDGGELVLEFGFLNLESDEPKHFSGSLRGSQNA